MDIIIHVSIMTLTKKRQKNIFSFGYRDIMFLILIQEKTVFKILNVLHIFLKSCMSLLERILIVHIKKLTRIASMKLQKIMMI